MIWKPTTTKLEAVPNLALRLLPPSDRRPTAGLGANAYGEITDEIRAIALNDSPTGKTLDVRVREKYAICSDSDYMFDSLAGYWATLEYRPSSNNKSLQKVLFRGVVSSESLQMSNRENGVDAVFWDRLAIADDVVDMYTGYYCIGTVLQMIDAMDIWPKDASDNRVAYIDPALFNRMEWTGIHSINDIPTPEAFVQALSSQEDLIPDIVYDGGNMVLTARERGAEEIALTVGTIRVQEGSKVYEVDLRELRGVKDYSRVVTRITGKGDYIRKADTCTLEPAWDRSLDNAVLENPSLCDSDPRYEEVGRLYTITGDMWPFNAESSGCGDTYEAIVWGRRSSDYEWMKIENDGELVPSGEGHSDPLITRSNYGFTNGQTRRYRFQSPQIWHEYTAAQQESRRSGIFVSPTSGFMNLELQAIYSSGILVYDTGYQGDLPIRRRRVLRNRDYSKLTLGDFWRRNTATVLGRQSGEPITYDHTPYLENQCLNAIAVTQDPYHNFTVIMPRCNFNLKRGTKVTRIYDRDGRIVWDGLCWYVENTKWPLNTGQEGSFTTEVQFDKSASEMLGGLVL